ncbi:transcription factor bHLH18-like [Canna indica]|uniref:Transcription factor bHLH18-like n=1 Tax=Canna indica TaxID=4628 RepID=A0AAQ3KYM0_9LILI|nr:transcription factor bHLH18-like [Canna indica]
MEQSSGQWPPPPPPEAAENSDFSFIYQPEMNSLDQFTVNQMMESLAEELLPSPNYASGSFPFESSSSGASAANYSSFGKHMIAGEREEALSINLNFGEQDCLLDPPAQLYTNAGKGGVVDAKHEISSSSSFFPSPGSTWSDSAFYLQVAPEKKSAGSRPPSGNQDHVIAERKRRERLSQQFIALSSIIPGLKKTDKASLLGDAISYIKQLEDKVKSLEDKASERTVESTILVKQTRLISTADQDHQMNPEPRSSSTISDTLIIPKITASLNGNSILVRIQCDKRKGLFVQVLSEIEKHHLSVINTSVMPFASSSLNITVTAQIEEGFSMTMKDFVEDLDSALSQFM